MKHYKVDMHNSGMYVKNYRPECFWSDLGKAVALVIIFGIFSLIVLMVTKVI